MTEPKTTEELLERESRRERGVYMDQQSYQYGVVLKAINAAMKQARAEGVAEGRREMASREIARRVVDALNYTEQLQLSGESDGCGEYISLTTTVEDELMKHAVLASQITVEQTEWIAAQYDGEEVIATRAKDLGHSCSLGPGYCDDCADKAPKDGK